ncbi:syntaxin-binding protein 5-like isoform X2 [Gordionus sp. m RMFG-2023]|uniref:syntaxin-binding protein 5-like isoform X2 n=1 Tax=Gordionus sp. m RMFG-2023 TaxID=3053472 RepID=UPI0031FC1961
MKRFTFKGVLENFKSSLSQQQKPINEVEEFLKKENFTFSYTIKHGFPYSATSLAYDPVQNLLAIGTSNGCVRILGKPGVDIDVKHDPPAIVQQLIFIINEGYLISACSDDILHLWDLKQNIPIITHSLKFQREKITFVHLSFQSKWLYVGTLKGNIHVVNIETFKLSGYLINWNKTIELLSKNHPGAVIHVSDNPVDPNKLLIGFETGSIVMWDLKNKCVDCRFTHNVPLKSVSWNYEGKAFMSSHIDGSLVTWFLKIPGNKPASIVFPHARNSNEKLEKCYSIDKIDWKTSKSGENLLLFSGGLTENIPTITIMHGKSTTVLEMEHNIIDFLSLCKSPYAMESEPTSIAVLFPNDLVIIDLSTQGYPCFENPFALDLHESLITLVQYYSDCPDQLVPLLYSVGMRQKKIGFSDKNWPLTGGECGKFSSSYPELLLTGHIDGTIKFWDASAMNLQILYRLKTNKIFERTSTDDSSISANTQEILTNSLTEDGKINTSQPVATAYNEKDEILHNKMKKKFSLQVVSLEFALHAKILVVALKKKRYSFVILYHFDKQEIFQTIPVLNIKDPNQIIKHNNDNQYSNNQGTANETTHNQTKIIVKPGFVKQLSGFQADLVLNFTPSSPPYNNSNIPSSSNYQSSAPCDASENLNYQNVTCLKIQPLYGLLVVGTTQGLCIVDYINKTLLINMNTQDLYGSSDPFVRSTPNKTFPLFRNKNIVDNETHPDRCKSPSIENSTPLHSNVPSHVTQPPPLPPPPYTSSHPPNINTHNTTTTSSVNNAIASTSSSQNTNAPSTTFVNPHFTSLAKSRIQKAHSFISFSTFSPSANSSPPLFFLPSSNASSSNISNSTNTSTLLNNFGFNNSEKNTLPGGFRAGYCSAADANQTKNSNPNIINASGPSIPSSNTHSTTSSQTSSIATAPQPTTNYNNFKEFDVTILSNAHNANFYMAPGPNNQIPVNNLQSPSTSPKSILPNFNPNNNLHEYSNYTNNNSVFERVTALSFYNGSVVNNLVNDCSGAVEENVISLDSGCSGGNENCKEVVKEGKENTKDSGKEEVGSGAENIEGGTGAGNSNNLGPLWLWMGTSFGSVLVLTFSPILPSAQKPVVISPTGTIFRLKGQILNIYFVGSLSTLNNQSFDNPLSASSIQTPTGVNKFSPPIISKKEIGVAKNVYKKRGGSCLSNASSADSISHSIPSQPSTSQPTDSITPLTNPYPNTSSIPTNTQTPPPSSMDSRNINDQNTNNQENFGKNFNKDFAVLISECQACSVSLRAQSYMSVIYKVKMANEHRKILVARVVEFKDQECMTCYASNGNILIYSVPSFRILIDIFLVSPLNLRLPSQDADRISDFKRCICFSNNGNGLYLCSPSEIQKFTYSTDMCKNLKDMTSKIFRLKETPEPPRSSFFSTLFNSPRTTALDREELFGEASGKARTAAVLLQDANQNVQAVASGPVHRARQAVSERGEKLYDLDEKTAQMLLQSENYSKNAHNILLKYKEKKWYQF